MAETVQIMIDGRLTAVASGSSVASVLLNESKFAFRQSEEGAPRAPLCGMGVCYECRVTIDGVQHIRACVTTVRDGMQVVTAEYRR